MTIRFDVQEETEPVIAMSLKKTTKRGHGTMTELNITPLLDLVFVLLVIFIITTPQLMNNLEMTLPSGKPPPPNKDKPKITRIEVAADSHITLDGETVTVAQLKAKLAALKGGNPNLAGGGQRLGRGGISGHGFRPRHAPATRHHQSRPGHAMKTCHGRAGFQPAHPTT